MKLELGKEKPVEHSVKREMQATGIMGDGKVLYFLCLTLPNNENRKLSQCTKGESLFSDAKVGENVVERVLRGDGGACELAYEM